jgi:hypothetical protein
MIDKTMCEVLWRNISDFYVNLRVEVGKLYVRFLKIRRFMKLEPLISHTSILMTFYLSMILDLQNFFHWYILQSWKLKRPQIPLRPHHFWTYTSNGESFNSPGPVACFTDEDDVSGYQNNCYWPLHSESIARCKHHSLFKYCYEQIIPVTLWRANYSGYVNSEWVIVA